MKPVEFPPDKTTTIHFHGTTQEYEERLLDDFARAALSDCIRGMALDANWRLRPFPKTLRAGFRPTDEGAWIEEAVPAGKDVARAAYMYADAMMAERARRSQASEETK